MSLSIDRIDHIVLTVSDIDQTVWFYCDVLGMQEIEYGENRIALKFGNQKINLHLIGSDISPKADRPTSGSADICLISQTSLDEVAAMLEKHGIEIEEGPVTRSGATGKIVSVYCRDPDGNLIEISNYKQ